MRNKRKKLLIVGLALIAIGLGALMVYRVFFVRLVRVPTGAMANTIIPGDHLIVRKLRGEVNRGDIVIFQFPNDSSVHYVKRVVGLPGERIQVRGYFVNVNGVPIPEQRVLVTPDDHFTKGSLEELSTEGAGPYRVFYYRRGAENPMITDDPIDAHFGVASEFHIPPNQYFLLGDHRDNSLDSRFRGAVPRELIWGKPTMIYWSSYRGQEYTIEFVPKVKIEVAVNDSQVQRVLETIIRTAKTGSIGDGKIFVRDLSAAVRIRTGETGESAL